MGRVVPISRKRTAGLVALTLLAAGSFAIAPEIALMLAPALLLLGLLLAGFMPGERALERLATRALAPRRHPLVNASPPRLTLVVRRTGRFVTQALAMRPPPAPRLVIR